MTHLLRWCPLKRKSVCKFMTMNLISPTNNCTFNSSKAISILYLGVTRIGLSQKYIKLHFIRKYMGIPTSQLLIKFYNIYVMKLTRLLFTICLKRTGTFKPRLSSLGKKYLHFEGQLIKWLTLQTWLYLLSTVSQAHLTGTLIQNR